MPINKIYSDIVQKNDNTRIASNNKLQSYKYNITPYKGFSTDKKTKEMEVNSSNFLVNWLGNRQEQLKENTNGLNYSRLKTSKFKELIGDDNDTKLLNPNEELNRQLKSSINAKTYLKGTHETYKKLVEDRERIKNNPNISNKVKNELLKEFNFKDEYFPKNSEAAGYYFRNDVYVDNKYSPESTKSIHLHEKAHALNAYPQENKIEEILKTAVINRESKAYETKMPEEYWDRPTEVYSRLMEFRKNNNIDPKRKFTIDDMNQYKPYDRNLSNSMFTEEPLKLYQKLNFLKDKKDRIYRNQLYLPNQQGRINIINKEIERINNELKLHNPVDSGRELFDRYDNNTMLRLLNEVAYNDSKKQNSIFTIGLT